MPTLRDSRTPSNEPTLLLVDDEPSVLDILRVVAEDAGFHVVSCSCGQDALDHLQRHRADIAAVDLHLPDVGGLEVLKAIRQADPDCCVVLMTGAGSIDSAIDAIKLGATDYLTKPIDFDRFRHLLTTVREDIARRKRLLLAEQEVARNAEFCGMIGRTPAMQDLFDLIRRLAPHVRTALITGETGTGKELVARALHRTGPRCGKPFVTINCSAVVEGLFESELFGHVRGAFTGASADKPGLFEVADHGTLFLDEIGELPLTLQAKLLRVLESGEVQRVGSVQSRRVDVYVLAATNRDLPADVAAGRFRADLFYRLNVVELWVPPLRERRDDIPYLTAAFVRESAARMHKRVAGLTPAAERALATASWKGNVRELRHIVERACIMADGDFISERNLMPRSGHAVTRALESASLSEMERQHIVEVLNRVAWNKMAAARVLGLTRWTLYRRMELYGIGAKSAESSE